MNKRYIVGFIWIMTMVAFIIVITVMLPRTHDPEDEPAYIADYTPQELAGRKVYFREGCFYCHSQFARVQDWDHGEVAQAQDYFYDRNNPLGTERTGPDLANIGNKFPDDWHEAHHRDPRAVKPGSIMPSFSYLNDEDMTNLIVYLQSLGMRGNRRKRAAILRGEIWPSDEEWARDRHEVPEYIRKLYEELIAQPTFRSIRMEDRFVVNGQGIYNQNCAVCHGLQGDGRGPAYLHGGMAKPPANFWESRFDDYDDPMWLWRIRDGIPGTQMPIWKYSLTNEQIFYVMQFMKHVALNNGLGRLARPVEGLAPSGDAEPDGGPGH